MELETVFEGLWGEKVILKEKQCLGRGIIG